MGIFDFFRGGNPLVAAKSTVKIFNEGLSTFGSYDRAFRYTYIFRNNTITRWAKHQRDLRVSEMFKEGAILNCTYITIAELNTGAAPKHVLFHETYDDFSGKISSYLRQEGIPEKYVSRNNRKCIAHIAAVLSEVNIIPPNLRDVLIMVD
jgi:hypothetical protein